MKKRIQTCKMGMTRHHCTHRSLCQLSPPELFVGWSGPDNYPSNYAQDGHRLRSLLMGLRSSRTHGSTDSGTRKCSRRVLPPRAPVGSSLMNVISVYRKQAFITSSRPAARRARIKRTGPCVRAWALQCAFLRMALKQHCVRFLLPALSLIIMHTIHRLVAEDGMDFNSSCLPGDLSYTYTYAV